MVPYEAPVFSLELPDPESEEIGTMEFLARLEEAWAVCDRFDLQTEIWRGRILRAVRDREKRGGEGRGAGFLQWLREREISRTRAYTLIQLADSADNLVGEGLLEQESVNNFSKRAFLETAQAEPEVQLMISEAANEGQQITRRHVEAVTIQRNHSPAGITAGQQCQGLWMVGIHMGDDVGLGRGQCGDGCGVGCQIGLAQPIRGGKATHQQPRLRHHPPQAEIAETGIERGIGVPRQPARLQGRVFYLFGQAGDGGARRCLRVGGGGLALRHQGAALFAGQLPGVLGEGGEPEQQRAIGRHGMGDQAGEGLPITLGREGGGRGGAEEAAGGKAVIGVHGLILAPERNFASAITAWPAAACAGAAEMPHPALHDPRWRGAIAAPAHSAAPVPHRRFWEWPPPPAG